MKTMKKCTLLLIVAFTFSLAAGIVCLTAAFNKTVFAGDGANVAMVDGASVKIDGTGIRFQSLIKKTYYDGLAEGKKTGIAIIPADLLQGELNQETDKAMLLYAAAQAHDDEKYAGYYVYNYALTDIPETSFGRKITARAFVKNGEEYIWADNVQSRSLAYVASAALQADSKGEAKYTADQKTALNGYIDGAINDLAYTAYQNELKTGETKTAGFTFTAKYAEDDVSDLKVIYKSDNTKAVTIEDGVLNAVGSGYAHVDAKLGGKTKRIRVYVTEKYILSASSEGAQTIPFSVPDGYVAELYVDDNNTSWGTVDNIVVPDAIKNDQTKHKAYSAYPLRLSVKQVGAEKEEGFTRNFSVAVATATISTESQWNEYIKATVVGTIKTGYYILGNDINITSGVLVSGSGNGYAKGFSGTVDGNGHSVIIGEGVDAKSGIFGIISGNSNTDRALVTDITIVDNSKVSPDWNKGTILADYVHFTDFNNVTININEANHKGETQYGAFIRKSIRESKFTNVTFNIKGKVVALFGGNNAVLSFNVSSKTEFVNCNINLLSPESDLQEVGHQGTVIYVAEGMATEGTIVEGISFNAFAPAEQTLSKQNISLAADAAAIDLGGYSDYTVTEITCDGEDLGKNPQNLALTENIKKKQGKL